LKELRVTFINGTFFSTKCTMHLPQLETLLLSDSSDGEDPVVHTMTTPRLRTFLVETRHTTYGFQLQMDLGLFIHVRVGWRQIPPLSALGGLDILQLTPNCWHNADILCPLRRVSVCPRLKSVEVYSSALSHTIRP
jgi:hypothetical protein